MSEHNITPNNSSCKGINHKDSESKEIKPLFNFDFLKSGGIVNISPAK